jgi:hypothetical protein
MFRLVEHGDDKFSLLEPLMLLDCKVQNLGLKKYRIDVTNTSYLTDKLAQRNTNTFISILMW